MGWLIALGILVLIAWIPLGVDAAYDSGGAKAAIVLGPVRIQVYPAKKKKEAIPSQTKDKPTPDQNRSGGPVSDFIPVAKLLFRLLKDLRRKLRVNFLQLNVILAGSDPCDLAQNYGKACAAMGNLWPQLERFLTIQKRDVRIQCDFEAETTLVSARLVLTITIGRLLHLGVRHGILIIREFLRISKKRKGGATL